MKSFGDLYRLKNQVESKGGDKEVYILSASDGTDHATMLAVRDYNGEIEIEIKGTDKTAFTVSESTEKRIKFKNTIVPIKDGKLTFTVKKDSIYYIKAN
jgi:hypothetical protein